MRIAKSGEYELPKEITDLQKSYYEYLSPLLASKYSCEEEAFKHMFSPNYPYFGYVLDTLDGVLQDKRIVDLGCGCVRSVDAIPSIKGENKDRMFEPWLCRGLYEINANVIGIDQGDLSSEDFHGEKLNLRTPNALHFIEEGSIDLVVAFKFFSSKDIINNRRDMWKKMLPEIEYVLKDNGTFLYYVESGLSME